jgi:FkbH-like protein
MTTPPTAPADLLDLHRTGRLAAHYPAVRRLLAGLDDAGLAAAGQVLSRLDPEQVLHHHPEVPVVTVALTGHGTLAPLIPPLCAELARHGLLLRPYLADFDSYHSDLIRPESDLYAAGPALILLVLDAMVVFDEVPVPWGPADVEQAATRTLAVVDRLAAGFQHGGRGTLVLNTLPLPRHLSAQLLDHRSRARLGAVWGELNTGLLRLADKYPDLVVVDLAPLIAEGIPAYDARLGRYARVHLSPALLGRYAREIGHLARHLTGRVRKVLALDLDGTLWGGILGEDGPAGIELGHGHRGEAFQAFQRVVRQLGAQGVLLAAVSKNEPEAVRAVLREHPGMALREEEFVSVIANWHPKPENLGELAAALNLGLDGFVFVDDSPYECDAVRHALPEVAVVRLDGEPARHVERLLRDGWFDGRDLTAEDRRRPELYRDELARKDFLARFDSVQEHLRHLGVAVRVCEVGADEAELARVSQLTLRTNQFNMTTARLGPAEVRAMTGDPACLVLAVYAGDRFGDNGLVGAVLTRRVADTLHLENFLLSCRVFARGIELAALATVLRRARDAGAATVVGHYRPTSKNHRVGDFYLRNGFTEEPAEGAGRRFRHDLARLPAPPDHIDLTESLGAAL